MTSTLTWVAAAVIAVPAAIALGLLQVLWTCWWAADLWAWFVVPLGAPGVTVWHPAGLALLGVVWRSEPHAERGETFLARHYTRELVAPPTFWAVGYVIKFWLL